MDFAGTAQRNPLLHYTKKIVADATEHDDRGDGPHDENEGHVFFISSCTNEERKREGSFPGTRAGLAYWKKFQQRWRLGRDAPLAEPHPRADCGGAAARTISLG